MVEQLIRNQQVAGSSPASSSKQKGILSGMLFCLDLIVRFESDRPRIKQTGPPKKGEPSRRASPAAFFWGDNRSPVQVRPVAPAQAPESVRGLCFGHCPHFRNNVTRLRFQRSIAVPSRLFRRSLQVRPVAPAQAPESVRGLCFGHCPHFRNNVTRLRFQRSIAVPSRLFCRSLQVRPVAPNKKASFHGCLFCLDLIVRFESVRPKIKQTGPPKKGEPSRRASPAALYQAYFINSNSTVI